MLHYFNMQRYAVFCIWLWFIVAKSRSLQAWWNPNRQNKELGNITFNMESFCTDGLDFETLVIHPLAKNHTRSHQLRWNKKCFGEFNLKTPFRGEQNSMRGIFLFRESFLKATVMLNWCRKFYGKENFFPYT